MFATADNAQLPHFVSPYQGLGVGRHVHVMERPRPGIHVPSSQATSGSTHPDPDIQRPAGDLGGPQATDIMVPRLGGAPSCSDATTQSEVALAGGAGAAAQTVSQQRRISLPSRLETMKELLMAQGYLMATAERIARPQRSTLNLYQSRWAMFREYCEANQRSTRNVPVSVPTWLSCSRVV